MQTLTAVSEEIHDLVARDEFFWLDLERPSEQDLERVVRLAGIDRRAADDTAHWEQLPQLREHDEQLFVVFYGAQPGTPPAVAQPVEVHLHVSGHWVVTVRRDPSNALETLRSQLGAEKQVTEALVVARILRALADTFSDLLEPLEERTERIEAAAARVEDTGEPTRPLRLQILQQRGRLLRGVRIVRRQRDYLDRAVEDLETLPGLERATGHDLGDIVNQMVRVGDRIDDARSRLDGALDLLTAAVSNRLNVIMERLTVVATIFLPLTVVTGFFGMNFNWMIDRIDTLAAFLVLGVGVFVLSGAAIYLWVRSRLERRLPD